MWVSQWTGGAWGTPTNLGSILNTAFDDMGPSLSACENILYFHSNRLGGQGMFDLYSSDYAFGAWASPQNLGPTVNSAFDDEWPSISSDGATLYFDSNRLGGSGLYDIWETSCNVQTTITTSPAGLTIIVDGNSCTSPQTFCWPTGSAHTIHVDSPQSGGTGIQYVYSHWSDAGAQTHTITVPSSSTTYTAFFTTQYFLTTNVCPPACGIPHPPCGTITAAPPGPWYNAGTTVSLTATPAATCLGVPGVPFSCWSGALTGAANPTTIVMSGPMYVEAVFSTCPCGVRGAVVNGGCTIDVLDVLAVVRHILGIAPLVGAPLCRGDCNADGTINILDAIGIVNCILFITDCAPKVGISPARVWTPEISLKDGETFELPIFVDSEVEIAGAQFTLTFDPSTLITGEPQVTERTGEMTVAHRAEDGNLTIVLYSLDGKSIPAGSGPILSLKFKTQNTGYMAQDPGLRFEEVILGGSCLESIPVDIQPIRLLSSSFLPMDFALSQNYPNPFNPVTTIEYALPTESSVKVEVYNLLGEQVEVLVDDDQQAGSYQVSWDASEKASGIYFYRLTAGDFTATKRMVLMK